VRADYASTTTPAPTSSQAASRPGPVRLLKSSDLFGSDMEVHIDHDGTLYRLKITRQGKLILNK
jgi:hemin uptake protein HemP